MNLKKHLYFAYGSNLKFSQMKKRCPGAEFVSKAKKINHILCFPIISSKRRNSGVASIKKSNGNVVEGVVYRISEGDLSKLDEFEAVGKRYKRKKVYIIKPDNLKKLVWTYFAISRHEKNFNPSKEYLGLILSGAREHKLSKNYIEKIKEG